MIPTGNRLTPVKDHLPGPRQAPAPAVRASDPPPPLVAAADPFVQVRPFYTLLRPRRRHRQDGRRPQAPGPDRAPPRRSPPSASCRMALAGASERRSAAMHLDRPLIPETAGKRRKTTLSGFSAAICHADRKRQDPIGRRPRRSPPRTSIADGRQKNRPRSHAAGISVMRSPTPLPFPAVLSGGSGSTSGRKPPEPTGGTGESVPLSPLLAHVAAPPDRRENRSICNRVDHSLQQGRPQFATG